MPVFVRHHHSEYSWLLVFVVESTTPVQSEIGGYCLCRASIQFKIFFDLVSTERIWIMVQSISISLRCGICIPLESNGISIIIWTRWHPSFSKNRHEMTKLGQKENGSKMYFDLLVLCRTCVLYSTNLTFFSEHWYTDKTPMAYLQMSISQQRCIDIPRQHSFESISTWTIQHPSFNENK
jgi:hypothetical protein